MVTSETVLDVVLEITDITATI
ncbi:uncharacterized protein G2W53_029461 [Senna tora]|uniref:Uncharacterized protein n=1 Tax=Senna tora TaxID=362788 RepID=A0A834T7N5_9FABA|nr:uncharacterized protein G2W53_029461 [Senna tora]